MGRKPPNPPPLPPRFPKLPRPSNTGAPRTAPPTPPTRPTHSPPPRWGGPRQNFACTVLESELTARLAGPDGAPTRLARLLDGLNTLFTAVFAAELALTACAYWFRRLVTDVWIQARRPRPPRRPPAARGTAVCALRAPEAVGQ